MSPAPLSNIEQVAEELLGIDKSLWRKETEPGPEDQKSTSTAPFGVQHEGRQWGFFTDRRQPCYGSPIT
jgi:hypothetical protein